jgi:NAD(P)-dependent dehydrogenase (short-subunit alcohol dehydrogenase family)
VDPDVSYALVTGASRGIGRAIAELLVARGRHVIASARDSEALRALERAHPQQLIALPHDLATDGASTLIERASALGALDEVVLAAGIARYAPFVDTSERDLRAQLDINFIAPFLLLQSAAKHMTHGSIVLVASTLAFRAAPATSAYAASKAALLSMAKSAALELAPRLRVNVLAPGVVDTEMVRVPRRSLHEGEDPVSVVAEQLEALRKLHPLGRLGTPEEIAEAALYLLDAKWLTGSVLTIDGGLTLS